MHSSVTAHANPTDIKEKNGQKNGTDIFLHRYRTGFMLPKLFCFSMSCCFSLSGSHLIARSRRSPFSFPFPYASSFSRLSKLNCTLDSPFTFHFLSACKTLFSLSSLAFIETQFGAVLHFHWTRPFTFFTIYKSISRSGHIKSFLQLTPH